MKAKDRVRGKDRGNDDKKAITIHQQNLTKHGEVNTF